MEVLRKVLGHSVIYGMGTVLIKVAGFLLLPMYTYALSPDDYGSWATVSMWAAGTGTLLDLGFTNALFRFIPDAGDRRGNVIGAALWVTAIAGGVITAVLVAMAPHLVALLVDHVLPGLAELFRIALVSAFLRALVNLRLTLIRVDQQPSRFVLWNVSMTVGVLLLNILFVGVLRWGVSGIMWAELIVVALAAAFLVLGLPVSGLTLDWTAARTMLAYGLPFVPTLVSSWVLDLSDRFFLERYAGMDQVGLYAVGYKIGMIPMLFTNAFTAGWGPLMAHLAKGEEAQGSYASVFRVFVAVAAVVALGNTLFARPLLWMMAAPAYADAWKIVGVVSFSYVLNGLHVLGLTGMALQRRTVYQPAIVSGAAILNMALNAWLIPSYGILAAAGTTLAAFALMAGLTFSVSQRLYWVPYPFRRAALVLGGAALAAAAAEVTLPPADHWALAARGLVVAAFCGALLMTGDIPLGAMLRTRTAGR